MRFLFFHGDGCKLPFLLVFFSAKLRASIAQPAGSFRLAGAAFSLGAFNRKGQEPDSRFAHF